MKTTLDIPDLAFGTLLRLTGAKTKREAVLTAVDEYNRRHAVKSLIASFGTWQMDSNDETEAADVAEAEAKAMSSVAEKVLVDSSAWIEVLRNWAAAPLRESVEKALHGQTAAMTEPVWLELYRGVRGKREMDQLRGLRQLCHWLPFDEACWLAATEISRRCRERGATVPLGDVLIYACAKRHGAKLIENDQHFALISKAADTAV